MSATKAPKSRPSVDFTRAERAAKFILGKSKLQPRLGIVLGSGLGAFGDQLAGAARIDYAKIPYFPRSTAIGHAGRMVIGKVADLPVAVMQGRVHYYEGYAMRDVIFPMRVMSRMGIRSVILTNAAGGVNRDYKPGSLCVLRDHMNLQGTNPLIGPNEDRFGVRFPDMTQVYYKPYREAALAEAKRLGIEIFQGVYAAVTGPSFETPAEICYLRTIGADLVGMSTVPEAIAASHLGIRVLAISCVTNMAAGILDQPITSEEVLETGERAKADFIALLRAVIQRIAEEPQ